MLVRPYGCSFWNSSETQSYSTLPVSLALPHTIFLFLPWQSSLSRRCRSYIVDDVSAGSGLYNSAFWNVWFSAKESVCWKEKFPRWGWELHLAVGAGRQAQWLRASTPPLTEDLGSVPSIHISWPITSCNSSSRGFGTLFRHLHSYTTPYKCN